MQSICIKSILKEDQSFRLLPTDNIIRLTEIHIPEFQQFISCILRVDGPVLKAIDI